MADNRKQPDKEAPASRAERARAERFADLVSTLVDGDPLPPAMTPEDRELIDVATMLRASTGGLTLSADRASAIAQQAIAAAGSTERPTTKRPTSQSAASADDPRDDLSGRRPGGARKSLPWLLTVTASAAALALWLARPDQGTRVARTAARAPQSLKAYQRSRPADRVVGMIARSDAHLASTRIDTIYADRLEGYRSLRLSAGVRRGGTRD